LIPPFLSNNAYCLALRRTVKKEDARLSGLYGLEPLLQEIGTVQDSPNHVGYYYARLKNEHGMKIACFTITTLR
jgi:hypothetical protein